MSDEVAVSFHAEVHQRNIATDLPVVTLRDFPNGHVMADTVGLGLQPITEFAPNYQECESESERFKIKLEETLSLSDKFTCDHEENQTFPNFLSSNTRPEKLLRTSVLQFGFFLTAFAYEFSGPALYDLMALIGLHHENDFETIGKVFAFRGYGITIGAVVSCLMFECFPGHTELILSVCFAGMSAAAALMPWCATPIALACAHFVLGLHAGAIGPGGLIYCLRIWMDTAWWAIHSLQFSLACGAAVIAILMRLFLSNNALPHARSTVRPSFNYGSQTRATLSTLDVNRAYETIGFRLTTVESALHGPTDSLVILVADRPTRIGIFCTIYAVLLFVVSCLFIYMHRCTARKYKNSCRCTKHRFFMPTTYSFIRTCCHSFRHALQQGWCQDNKSVRIQFMVFLVSFYAFVMVGQRLLGTYMLPYLLQGHSLEYTTSKVVVFISLYWVAVAVARGLSIVGSRVAKAHYIITSSILVTMVASLLLLAYQHTHGGLIAFILLTGFATGPLVSLGTIYTNDKISLNTVTVVFADIGTGIGCATADLLAAFTYASSTPSAFPLLAVGFVVALTLTFVVIHTVVSCNSSPASPSYLLPSLRYYADYDENGNDYNN